MSASCLLAQISLMAALWVGLVPAFAQPVFTPNPKQTIFEKNTISMPTTFRFVLKDSRLRGGDPGLEQVRAAFAAKGCHEKKGAMFTVRVGLLSSARDCREVLELAAPRYSLPDHKEACFVTWQKCGVVIGGHSPRALYYGLLTLAQWIESSPMDAVRQGWILDWPSLDHRALMIDLARLMEKKDYYRKMLVFLSEYKYNVLVLHLTDDPTIALRFDSHPEPADPHAWTVDEMKDFVDLAELYHIDLLPEIELFGHARGWTSHPKYEHLGEPGVPTLSPHQEGTWELIEDLVVESTDIFPYELFHAGLDEVQGPTSKEGKAFVKKHGKGRWLTDHIRRVHEIVSNNDKRLVMWGDMMLHYPEAAYAIPRDAIIYDWHYQHNFDERTHPKLPPDSWIKFREMGFDVVAAPAFMCGYYRLWPDYQCFMNVTKTTRMASEYGLMGTAITVWLPTRYLPDSIWYAFAVGGDAAWSGTGFDRAGADAAFFWRYYGLELTEKDRQYLDFLLQYTPMREDLLRLLWFDEGRTKRFLEQGGYRIKDCYEHATMALDHFTQRAAGVERHRKEYEDFLRVARVIQHLAWRERHGREILTDPYADRLRSQCRTHTQRILRNIKASYSAHRHADLSRIENNSYGSTHIILRDFEKALVALDELKVE
jgi:hexosaminidase